MSDVLIQMVPLNFFSVCFSFSCSSFCAGFQPHFSISNYCFFLLTAKLWKLLSNRIVINLNMHKLRLFAVYSVHRLLFSAGFELFVRVFSCSVLFANWFTMGCRRDAENTVKMNKELKYKRLVHRPRFYCHWNLNPNV